MKHTSKQPTKMMWPGSSPCCAISASRPKSSPTVCPTPYCVPAPGETCRSTYLGGLFVALFGIPIGAGGVGVLVGLLGAVAGLLVAYFAVTGGVLLVGALFMLVGLIRFAMPHLWDNLVSAGFIQMNGPPAEFLDRFSPVDQGIIMIVLAGIFGVAGLGLLWMGKP